MHHVWHAGRNEASSRTHGDTASHRPPCRQRAHWYSSPATLIKIVGDMQQQELEQGRRALPQASLESVQCSPRMLTHLQVPMETRCNYNREGAPSTQLRHQTGRRQALGDKVPGARNLYKSASRWQLQGTYHDINQDCPLAFAKRVEQLVSSSIGEHIDYTASGTARTMKSHMQRQRVPEQ